MDITKAQFPNLPNVAGQETFSYAELLAQLAIDLPGGVSGTEGELISFDIADAVENVTKGTSGQVLTANAIGIPSFQAGGGGGGGNAGLGAQVRLAGSVSLAGGGFGLHIVDWSVNGGPSITFDDFGMYNPAQPDRLSIPGGEAITRVVMQLRCQWQSNSTGQRGLFSDRNQGTAHNGSITMTQNAVSAGSHNMSGASGVIPVIAGGSFLRMGVSQNTAGNLLLQQAEMSVWVIRD